MAARPASERTPSSPRARRAGRAASLSRFAPSGRVLLVVGALAAVLVGGFMVARRTSVFAVRVIDVRGAPPSVAEKVRAALAGWRGTNLVGLDGAGLVRRVDALPSVASVTYDRAFPHTLRVLVSPEQPVAVLRRGRQAWLVSARARVLQPIGLRQRRHLPRIWVPTAAPVMIGQTLSPREGGEAAHAVAPVAHDGFPVRIATAVLSRGELVLDLASHLEVRLGRPTDVRLKLAIARRIVEMAPAGTAYVDVSVPERPVAGPSPQTVAAYPQVSG